MREVRDLPRLSDTSSAVLLGKVKKILCVNTYQMVLLLMFNTRDKITYEEMKEETMIPDRELTRALQPLSVGKASQRILVKTPKSKEIEPSHTFQINDSFSSAFHRIKIQQVSVSVSLSVRSVGSDECNVSCPGQRQAGRGRAGEE